ncbi:MAG: Gldg family protein, partial [Polyangiaceae bacterium]|nr:Gldg family protein [Polyangiaceae bacterium]
TRNFPFYTFIDVDLKDGNTAIQDELDGIVITQPGKDYSEKELRQIDAFLLKGKSVTVIASAVNVKPSDPSMNATLSTHGLEKLLDGYGIEMKKDAVLEFYYAFRVPIMTQSGIASAVVPTIVHSHEDPRFQGNEQLLDTGYPIFFRMPEVMFPFASTLVTNPSKQPDAKMTVLARTTPKSIALTGETAELKPFQRWTQKGTPEQRVISVAMEGTFKTAFPTGDKQGVVTPEKGAPGKLLVISSAQFLANPFARAGNGPDMPQMHGMQMPGMGGDQELLRLAGPYANNALKPTILAFKNVLDWMSGDIDLLAASAKILGEPQLSYGDLGSFKFDENETPEQAKKRAEELKDMRKRQQSSTEWILILGIPLLLAAFGGLRWRMRQASRENAVLA